MSTFKTSIITFTLPWRQLATPPSAHVAANKLLFSNAHVFCPSNSFWRATMSSPLADGACVTLRGFEHIRSGWRGSAPRSARGVAVWTNSNEPGPGCCGQQQVRTSAVRRPSLPRHGAPRRISTLLPMPPFFTLPWTVGWTFLTDRIPR